MVNLKILYFLFLPLFLKEYPTNGNTENPEHSWTINYTNGRKHTLSSALVNKKKNPNLQQLRGKRSSTERKQKWISAMNEHIRFSESQVESQQNENKKQLMPMESLQQNLNVSKL